MTLSKETNKRIRDKAAHACRALCRARIVEEMQRHRSLARWCPWSAYRALSCTNTSAPPPSGLKGSSASARAAYLIARGFRIRPQRSFNPLYDSRLFR
jgi:hypothetical protein